MDSSQRAANMKANCWVFNGLPLIIIFIFLDANPFPPFVIALKVIQALVFYLVFFKTEDRKRNVTQLMNINEELISI